MCIAPTIFGRVYHPVSAHSLILLREASASSSAIERLKEHRSMCQLIVQSVHWEVGTPATDSAVRSVATFSAYLRRWLMVEKPGPPHVAAEIVNYSAICGRSGKPWWSHDLASQLWKRRRAITLWFLDERAIFSWRSKVRVTLIWSQFRTRTLLGHNLAQWTKSLKQFQKGGHFKYFKNDMS